MIVQTINVIFLTAMTFLSVMMGTHAYAGGNSLIVEQIGQTHKSSVVQHGSGNSTSVKQDRPGYRDNRAKVYQGPNGKKPTQSDVGDFFGWDANSSKFMFDLRTAGNMGDSGSGNTLSRDLNSDGEFGDTDELSRPSPDTPLSDLLNLGGDVNGPIQNNTAEVIQRGGSGNRALAVQIGRGNDLLTKQTGGNNIGIHIQRGNDNTTNLIQKGDGNRNALVATGNASGNGGPFTLKVEGSNVADGLAVQVQGQKTFGGFKVTPNDNGGFNMTPIQHGN